MSTKRKILYAFFFLLLAASLTGCILAALFLYVPRFVESRIIPDVAARFGVDPLRFEVRGIRFDGTDLGPIVLGAPEAPALELESVRIGYSPLAVRHGRLGRVVVSGLKVHARLDGGRFSLRGFDLDQLALGDNGAETSPRAAAGPVPGFESLALRNATLFLTWDRKTVVLPLEIVVTPRNGDHRKLDFSFSAFPQGGRLTASGKADLEAGTVDVDYRGEALSLGALAGLLPPLPGLRLSGVAGVQGSLSVGLRPLALTAFAAAAELRGLDIARGALGLTHSRSGRGAETPVTLKAAGGGGGAWQFSLEDAVVAAPVTTRIETLSGKLVLAADSLQVNGGFSLQVRPFEKPPPVPVNLSAPLPLKGRFGVSWASPGRWAFTLDSLPEKERGTAAGASPLTVGGLALSSGAPAFTATGSGTADKGEGTLRLKLPEAKARGAMGGGRVREAALNGKLAFERPGGGLRYSADVTLSAPGLDLKSPAAAGRVEEVTVAGSLRGGATGIEGVDAQLRLTGAAFADPAGRWRLEGGRGAIPFRWPVGDEGPKGMVSLSGIRFDGRDLGSLAAVLTQKAGGFTVSGTHVNRLVPELKVILSGSIDLEAPDGPETRVAFDVSGYRPPRPVDLGAYLPDLDGGTVDGELNVSGELTLGPYGPPVCPLEARVTDAAFALDEKGLTVAGVDAEVAFPDLLKIRSAPAQRIRYESIEMGDLRLEEGRIEFQLESDGSVFVEKGSFRWCGGSVDVHAIRFSPGVDDYLFVLYCDRLRLTQILEQLGAVKAEGSGTLSGKLPVRLAGGQLRFDDGFLYSSPGEGGSIRLSGTEILTAGIPRDTLQYAQLELAREALKDYSYHWVKLGLNTEDETLLLRMQMDGKPSGELPFRYDEKIGGFVKVASGVTGSIFQGISLDVNFRLPLDKIMTYQDILKNLE